MGSYQRGNPVITLIRGWVLYSQTRLVVTMAVALGVLMVLGQIISAAYGEAPESVSATAQQTPSLGAMSTTKRPSTTSDTTSTTAPSMSAQIARLSPESTAEAWAGAWYDTDSADADWLENLRGLAVDGVVTEILLADRPSSEVELSGPPVREAGTKIEQNSAEPFGVRPASGWDGHVQVIPASHPLRQQEPFDGDDLGPIVPWPAGAGPIPSVAPTRPSFTPPTPTSSAIPPTGTDSFPPLTGSATTPTTESHPPLTGSPTPSSGESDSYPSLTGAAEAPNATSEAVVVRMPLTNGGSMSVHVTQSSDGWRVSSPRPTEGA